MYEMSDRPVGRDKTVVPLDDDVRSGASPVTVTLDSYRTGIWTDGVTGAGQSIVLPSGTYVGQRKLITMDNKVGGSDTAVVNGSNVTSNAMRGETPVGVSTVTFDANDEYALFEWTGSEWNLIYTNATVA